MEEAELSASTTCTKYFWEGFDAARPCPSFPWFFGFYQGKPQNFQGFSGPTKPTKSLEKTENQKNQGKEGLGSFPLKIFFSCSLGGGGGGGGRYFAVP